MSAPQAYPLSWPRGRPRTPPGQRKRSPFTSYKRELTIYEAMQRLQLELDRLGARNVTLSSNTELRVDGTPRSDRRSPDDTGVACYFSLQGEPTVLASDLYTAVAGNIAAIAKHIEASRAIERYGVGTLKQIFGGFAALPPAMAPDDWRSVLGDPMTLAEAEARYRETMLTAHPDRGGSVAGAAKLNAAIAAARKALT